MHNYFIIIGVVAILFVLTGSINISTSKEILSSLKGGYFFVSTLIYFGELICIYIYQLLLCNKSFVKSHKRQIYSKLNKFIFIFPIILDCLYTTFTLLALQNLDMVVYTMLRISNLVITAILSMYVLRTKLYRHHLIGIVLMTAGSVLLGYYYNEGNSLQNPTTLVGLVYLIASFIFYSLENVVQQYILSKHDINSLEVVGLEGLYGVSIMMLLLPLYYLISNKNLYTIPNILKAIFTEYKPFTTLSVFIFSVCFYNICNTYLVKTTSASTIATLEPFKVVLISILDKQTTMTSIMKYIGFYGLIIFGAFIYHELIELPFCNLSIKTLSNLLKSQRSLKQPKYEMYDGKNYQYSMILLQSERPRAEESKYIE